MIPQKRTLHGTQLYQQTLTSVDHEDGSDYRSMNNLAEIYNATSGENQNQPLLNLRRDM